MVDQDALVNDFLRRYLADADAGRVQTSAAYQAMYPEAREIVAAEYGRLRGETVTDTGFREIGRYRVLDELGRGGQGTVYLAEDRRLGRKAAVKLLTGWSAGSPEHRARFQREAKMASQLEHPGICTVYDAGVHEGHPYIAMRFVEGETLAQRTASAQAPPSNRTEMLRAATIVELASRALDAAHESGIVHRDVKPGNIQITGNDQPVILDFGLAHAAEDETLTRSGDVFGTPAYMAPEQIRGEHADPRTDVYALGVILYELLTLQRPFEAPTREALYRDILRREPIGPRRLNAAVPRDLEVIVQTAMAKELDRRYRSAEQLADDLARFRRDEPVEARPVSITGRALRWVRREPARAMAAGTVLIAALVVAGLGGYLLSKREAIDLGETRMRESRYEALLGAGYEQVGEWNPTLAMQAFEDALRLRPESVEALAGLALAHERRGDHDAALRLLEDPSAVDAAGRVALDWVRVHVLREAGRAAEAEAMEETLPEPRGSLQLFVAGIVALQRGDLTGDQASFDRALDLLDRAQTNSDRARLFLHTQCAHAASHVGDERPALRFAESLEYMWPDSPRAWFHIGLAIGRHDPRRGERAYRKAISLAPRYAVAHLNLAALLEERGDLGAAVARHEKAWALDPRMARAPYNLGHIAQLRGNRERARQMYVEALAIDPEYAEAHNNLASMDYEEGRFDDAIARFRAAVASKPDYPEAWNNLGSVLARTGQYDEAADTLLKAVELRPDYLSVHVNLGALFLYTDELESAARHLERALAIDSDSAVVWCNLGAVRHELGDLQEATRAYETALDLQPGMVMALANLGLVHLEAGDYDEARRCFREALAENPVQVHATRGLADLLFREGDTAGAVQLLEKILAPVNRLTGPERQGLEEDLARYRR